MRGRFAPYVVGIGLLALAGAMTLFAGWARLAAEPWLGFVVAAAAAATVGVPLAKVGHASSDPSRRETLVAVLLLWLLLPVFGAIPYAVSGGFSIVNALFESMSGFTATGATVLDDFDRVSDSLFMFRSLTQWIGGVGIILLFIAVFPQLAIAGRQLFFAEMPGPTEERLTPRLRKTANAVLLVYAGLTGLCAAAYIFAGMTPFDGVAHAFTTMAASGFSPRALSFEEFASPLIDWIAIGFMTVAGTSFVLQIRVLSGRPLVVFRDVEFRAYLAIILVAGASITLLLLPTYDTADALRHGLFQTLSILTTTGYASTDYAAWDARPQAILIVLMFIGGSAGSAAGGVKIMRWLIIGKNTAREVRRSLHPRAELPLRVGSRIVPEEVLRAVAAYITLYVGLFAVSTVVLVLLGADFVTAFTASIGCLGNIGPGLAGVGPMASYADLHPVSRGLLTFNMYAGRLELVTVFVILTPAWWRLPRQRFFGSGRARLAD